MIPIPTSLQKFPLWRGVYPIHYTVWTDAAGNPDFKVMHERRREECFGGNRCHLCGETLGGEPILKTKRSYRSDGHLPAKVSKVICVGFKGGVYALIGGPKCVEGHKFVDGPMHVECAEYAARACPYLASPSGVYKAFVPTVVVGSAKANPLDGALIQAATEKTNTRPARMALVTSASYTVERNRITHAFEGGSHADDPSAPLQLTANPGPYLRVDWSIMPQAEEK